MVRDFNEMSAAGKTIFILIVLFQFLKFYLIVMVLKPCIVIFHHSFLLPFLLEIGLISLFLFFSLKQKGSNSGLDHWTLLMSPSWQFMSIRYRNRKGQKMRVDRMQAFHFGFVFFFKTSVLEMTSKSLEISWKFVGVFGFHLPYKFKKRLFESS